MPAHTIGIDEAGRGPLAGPVAVGAVLVPSDFDWTHISGVADSKQLSEGKREALFVRAHELKKTQHIDFRVTLVGAHVIDRIGITRAVRLGIVRTLTRLAVEKKDAVHIKLDGLLTAPKSYKNQRTITRGDQREQEIALASILAKVTRDRHMARMAARHPAYGFERHKGYGTAAHKSALAKHGPCPIHRTTFIKH